MKMKKYLSTALAAVLALVAVFALVACTVVNGGDGYSFESYNDEYYGFTVLSLEKGSNKTMMQFLDKLVADYEQDDVIDFTYTAKDGFINAVNGKEGWSTDDYSFSQYWGIFTDDETYIDANSTAYVVEPMMDGDDELELKSSNKGAAEIIVKEGKTYALVWTTYGNLVNKDAENKTYTFAANDRFLKATADTKVANYIDALIDKGMITISMQDSDYGIYITSVEGIANDVDEGGTSGHSWMVYTTDEAYHNEYSTEITIGGVTYKSSSMGISNMNLKAGASYALVFEAWQYN